MFKSFPLRCCKDYACNCCSNEEEDKDNNKEFNQTRIRNLNKRKIILLGNAEAGKSTFLKQMKLMHGGGYKEEEKRRLIPVISQQIINIIRCICQAMQTLHIPFGKSQNENYIGILNTINSDDETILTLSSSMVEAIKHIWSDEGAQLCYHRRREYRLTDSAKYFLDSIDRISEKNYLPNDDDILRVRIPTMDIVQEDFQCFGCHLQIVDVGGQKIERQKWLHCFDNVTTIIFFASLIEYDQHIIDDPSKQNLMKESLALFRVILSSDYFHNATIILFLNKTDIFPERLANKPLRDTFPEFDGADDDVEAAKEFVKNKYLSVELVKSYFTCSIDKKNIKIVFDEVKRRIFIDIIDHI